MNKRMFIVTFMIILILLNATGCTKKIDLYEEYNMIEKVAEALIIDDFDKDFMEEKRELIEDSIKIHEITEIDTEIYLLYSYRYKITQSVDKLVNDEFYFMGLNVIHRNNTPLGYKLMGGGGGGGDIQSTPITMYATGNKMYGLIQNREAAKLIIEFNDGEVISYDVNEKDYYLIIREDSENAFSKKVYVLDKNENVIYKFE